MPLLDHLIELRTRLIYCLAGFVVAFFICFYLAEDIFGFLVRPLSDALRILPHSLWLGSAWFGRLALAR